jgi:hypothetical protein
VDDVSLGATFTSPGTVAFAFAYPPKMGYGGHLMRV